MIRKAAIDIGTNTTRLLIADLTQGNTFTIVFSRRIITRLGEGLCNHKHLNETATQRTINALKIYSKDIKKYNCLIIRAVATSAVREADNGKDFVQKVKNETGLNLEIISQEEEARLATLGVFNGLKEKPEKAIIFDVGGGSTEFILADNRANPVKRPEGRNQIELPLWRTNEKTSQLCIRRCKKQELTAPKKNKFLQGNIIKTIELSMGVVHLTEKHIKSDPVSQEDLRSLKAEIKKKLTRVKKEIGSVKDFTLIGTAGTPTQFAALDLNLFPYDPVAVNGHSMSLHVIEKIFNELKSKTNAERKAIRAMEHGREDLVVAGGVILLESIKLFNKNEMIISDFGLREGIIIDLSSNHSDEAKLDSSLRSE